MIREIEAFATDPALDAATVATRLWNYRPLCPSFAGTDRTDVFRTCVRPAPLARAIELLRDPAHGLRRIADIAFAVGFRDLSYFNRMFRRKYGGTPTDIRLAPNGWRRDK